MNVTSWFVDTIQVFQRSGLGGDGDPDYGAASTISARVVKKTVAVTSSSGDEIFASHHISSLTDIQEDDQVLLAGESKKRRCVKAEQGRDKSGNVTHYEAWF